MALLGSQVQVLKPLECLKSNLDSLTMQFQSLFLKQNHPDICTIVSAISKQRSKWCHEINKFEETTAQYAMSECTKAIALTIFTRNFLFVLTKLTKF